MHETSIMQAVLEQVRAVMPEGAVLREVHLEVGDLEHLDEEVMRTAWTVLTDGSALAGAVLAVTRVPLRVRCRACGHEFVPEEAFLMLCPQCEAIQPEVLEGTGVLLRRMTVDESGA